MNKRAYRYLLPWVWILAVAIGQGSSLVCAQHLTYSEWKERSVKDARLSPRFEGHSLNAEQHLANGVLVQHILDSEPDRRKASDRLVALADQHLAQGDLVNAMYRYNHAWLVDSTNASVYEGQGRFFLALDHPREAGRCFMVGLEQDSTHVPLLKAMASALIADQEEVRRDDPDRADLAIRTALRTLTRAKAYAPKDPEIALKRGACHLLLGECEQAQEAYQQHQQLVGEGDRTLLFAIQEQCGFTGNAPGKEP